MTDELPAGTIVPPSFCEWHKSDLIRMRLKIPDTGPWMVALITAQILMFTWSTTEKSVNDRLGSDGEPADLTLILNEIGCLACAFGDGFDRATILIRGDISHAAKVAQGRAKDPVWPIDQRVEALKAAR